VRTHNNKLKTWVYFSLLFFTELETSCISPLGRVLQCKRLNSQCILPQGVIVSNLSNQSRSRCFLWGRGTFLCAWTSHLNTYSCYYPFWMMLFPLSHLWTHFVLFCSQCCPGKTFADKNSLFWDGNFPSDCLEVSVKLKQQHSLVLVQFASKGFLANPELESSRLQIHNFPLHDALHTQITIAPNRNPSIHTSTHSVYKSNSAHPKDTSNDF
jgi:hypothetical protein